MKRTMVAALALVFALGLMPQAARAQDNNCNTFWTWLTRGQDPPAVLECGVGIGAGTDVAGYLMTKKHGNPACPYVSFGTAYGVTTFACAVVYPIVGTLRSIAR